MSGARRGRRSATTEPTGARPALQLRWSRRAESDLEAIYDYIAADDPVAAARWVERLMERASKVAPLPYAGRVVREFGLADLREVLVRTYRIVYRIREREVQVITVFEGHRLFPADVDIAGDTDEDG